MALYLLVVMLSLSLIVLILSAHGTRVKNKWGVNKQPVFCPHCKTQFPTVRQPQSLRQAMWGGWTCEVCGIEVDKWGRELASVGPGRRIMPPGQIRRATLKWGTIVFIPVYFCITLLLRWPNPRRGFTFAGIVAFLVVSISILETAIVTLALYFCIRFLYKSFPEKRAPDSAQANETDRTPKA